VSWAYAPIRGSIRRVMIATIRRIHQGRNIMGLENPIVPRTITQTPIS
jgi:hypothetical protein